jgi:hypothetical protein
VPLEGTGRRVIGGAFSPPRARTRVFRHLEIGQTLPCTDLVAEEQDPFCLSLG